MVSEIQKIFDALSVDPEWAPNIATLRRLRTHDIVAVTQNDGGLFSVVCSCGLIGEVLPEIPMGQIAESTTSPWIYRFRKFPDALELEEWFYRQPGHLYAGDDSDPRAFIVRFTTGEDWPSRKIWCSACDDFQRFYSGGGTHLYRPGAHTEQVEKHLADCAAIAREDRLREWSHTMWRAVMASKPGTKTFGRPPLARDGDTPKAPGEANDSDNN
jgi:hypothetical protein